MRSIVGVRRIGSHIKAVVLGYWQGGVVWVVGASLGGAYADEGRLRFWLSCYGCGVVGSGALWMGDGLYGHRARLFSEVEDVGWLPVVRVREGVWNRVRADVRQRAQARADAYRWALGARYRIEPVFGVVKGVCGSDVRCRSEVSARVRVWGMLVLWNRVQWVKLGGIFCVVCVGVLWSYWVYCVRRENFRTLIP